MTLAVSEVVQSTNGWDALMCIGSLVALCFLVWLFADRML